MGVRSRGLGGAGSPRLKWCADRTSWTHVGCVGSQVALVRPVIAASQGAGTAQRTINKMITAMMQASTNTSSAVRPALEVGR